MITSIDPAIEWRARISNIMAFVASSRVMANVIAKTHCVESDGEFISSAQSPQFFGFRALEFRKAIKQIPL